MLELYRRHSGKCKHRSKGPGYTKCACPVWVYGRIAEDLPPIRESLKTRDWERATKRVKDRLANPEAKPAIRLDEAIKRYLRDCEQRQLADGTMRAYRAQLAHLTAYAPDAHVQAITPEWLAAYRATRTIAASTSRKELETLRGFCDFCSRMGWLASNPAKALKPPLDQRVPTLPFTQDEVRRILAACDTFPDRNPLTIDRTRRVARARVLVMLYSGLRISDTVALRRASVDLDTGRCLLRQAKTRQPVYVTLGQPVLDALAALPQSGEYFFWSGRGSVKAAIGGAQRSVLRLMRHAGIENGHPHRFRDTFSVRLMEQGADLRTVQMLLGHGSIRTTERHYAPWVQSMQRALDAATERLDFVQNSVQENLRGDKLLKIM